MLYKKSMDIKKIRLILWALVGIVISIFAYTSMQHKNNVPALVAIENFGGDFTLTNHLGQTVTQADFKNKNRLIYFGFTYCPAICPTELQRIATVINELGETGNNIEPIFITVDPERDTVDVMKDYVSLFHPRMVGLTGTPEQIDVIKKAYKIYAAKVQDETMNDYTVDHSSFIYFIDDDDTLIRIFKMDDTTQHMIKIIRNHMEK
jgi:protein SCO1/2